MATIREVADGQRGTMALNEHMDFLSDICRAIVKIYEWQMGSSNEDELKSIINGPSDRPDDLDNRTNDLDNRTDEQIETYVCYKCNTDVPCIITVKENPASMPRQCPFSYEYNVKPEWEYVDGSIDTTTCSKNADIEQMPWAYNNQTQIDRNKDYYAQMRIGGETEEEFHERMRREKEQAEPTVADNATTELSHQCDKDQIEKAYRQGYLSGVNSKPVDKVISRAIVSERERCARIVREYRLKMSEHFILVLLDEIAEKIRSGE